MKDDCTVNIFEESCCKTREIFDLIMVLQQSVGTIKQSVILDGCKKLRILQNEMQQTDLELDKSLKNGLSLSTKESETLAEKTRLQKEILQLNKKLIPQINNIKSTLAAEMSSLKTGRTALKGYGDKSRSGGKVINKSW